MTRSQFILHLSTHFPELTTKDIDLIVKIILDSLSYTLANGGRVELRGFGSFVLNYRPPRQGRNPKTGEKVMVPAKYAPHFRPGKIMRERIDY